MQPFQQIPAYINYNRMKSVEVVMCWLKVNRARDLYFPFTLLSLRLPSALHQCLSLCIPDNTHYSMVFTTLLLFYCYCSCLRTSFWAISMLMNKVWRVRACLLLRNKPYIFMVELKTAKDTRQRYTSIGTKSYNLYSPDPLWLEWTLTRSKLLTSKGNAIKMVLACWQWKLI